MLIPSFSQMLSAVMLLLQLWDNGTRETDNERSAQGTSAPLLPLLQRFQSIICNKDMPNTEEEIQVCILGLFKRGIMLESNFICLAKIITKLLKQNWWRCFPCKMYIHHGHLVFLWIFEFLEVGGGMTRHD